MTKLQSRREFCAQAVAASAAACLATHSTVKANEATNASTVPDHLPRKLAVCSSQWAWFTLSGPDEPYHDLEAVMIGLKERNYNAIRIDTALNWCFQKDGSPRGDVAIRATVPGYSHRFKCVNHQGGNSVDVLKRLVRFMTLAKKYDIYVILSDWEYMHTTWFVESEALRNEIMAIPTPERLNHLARHMDRLVTMLKEEDLVGNIAWIEPANEADIAGLAGRDNLRWHTDAVAFLRDRHPDILASASLAMINNISTTDNSQIYDHHLYVGKAIYGDFYKAARENTDNPWQNELLKKLLEPNLTPFSAFAENFPFDDTGWITNFWALYNVNIDQFDRWLAGNYQRDRASLLQNAADYYAKHAEEAKRRGLPMVVTEGGFFYSPLYSCFEESEAGLEYFDYLTDLAIENDVWGFAFSTYNGPEMPVWWARQKWLTETNHRFLKGVSKHETT